MIKRVISITVGVLSLLIISGCSSSFNQLATYPLSSFTEQDKSDLLSFVYQEGEFPSSLRTADNAVVVVLWEKGKRVGASFVQWGSLRANITRALAEATAQWGKEVNNDAPIIHLHLLETWQPYDSLYVHGGDAVMLSTGETHSVYWWTYALEENKTEQDVRTLLCESFELGKSCAMQPWVSYLYAHELHIGRGSNKEVVTYTRGKVVDPLLPFDLNKVQEALAQGKWRLVDNLDEEGKFTYVYNPTPATYSDNNNLIRQFMASRLLAQLSVADANLLEAHKRNLAYIFATRYREDERNGRVVYADSSKLWANAMLLRALVASPYFDLYTAQAEKLATTLLDAQNKDGSFEPWWIEPGYAYDEDYLLTFYSGEAIVALLEYYKKTNQKNILDAAILAQDFYIEEYVTQIDENYYPAYVPWHTISLHSLFFLTKDTRYAQAIFVLNDKLIDEMLHTPTKKGPQDLIGRFYTLEYAEYGSPHAASDGVYLEGIAYAYEIATLVWDVQHQKKYRDAIELALHNIYTLQYDVEDAYFVESPERVLWAVRFNATDNRIRIDTTQHVVDALIKIEDVLGTTN